MKIWGLFLMGMTLTDFALLKFTCFDTVGVLFLSMCCAPALLLLAGKLSEKKSRKQKALQSRTMIKNQSKAL